MICKEYYALDYNRRKDFILHNIEINQVKSKKEDDDHIKKHRNVAVRYYLPNDLEKILVCKDFFMSTLAIGHDPIENAIKNRNSAGLYTSSDGRGSKPPHNKTSDLSLNVVRQHIKSIPTMESHYSRKSTHKLYLDQSLNVKKMYE